MGIHGGVEDFETKVRATSRRLAQQGIILYIVDSKGLELSPNMGTAARGPTPVRGRGRFEPQMDTEAANNDPTPAMELMANITGGRYLHNTNDLTTGFKQTYADMQGSYTLGFYLAGDPDDKWHKLKVRVKKPGVDVRNREGYLADSTPTQPAAWTADTWRSAFANPVASTVIPLTARLARTPAGEVTMILRIDPNALQFHPDGDNLKAELEIGIADRAPDGSTHSTRAPFTASVASSKWEEARQTGLGYQKQWKPAEGATTVRIIVRDVRSGQYGSIEAKL
jgi:hypothetical protein